MKQLSTNLCDWSIHHREMERVSPTLLRTVFNPYATYLTVGLFDEPTN